MNSDLSEVLFSEDDIRAAVSRIANEIRRDYDGKNPVIVGVLKGSVVFYSDLIRALGIECTLDFCCASSYGGTRSSGCVSLEKDIKTDIAGRDVILIEDILDTGNTLLYLREIFLSRNPSSIKICAFLDKPSRRLASIRADYRAFKIADEFVVGYGMDYDEKYRYLPYIGVLRRDIYE